MTEQNTDSADWDDIRYGGVTVAEFQTEEDCNFAVYLLLKEGIQSAVVLPERGLDVRAPQLRVAPDDEQAAREILAQPIAANARSEYDAEPDVEPFALPCCPKCKSMEIVLEGIADGNLWRCEGCGGRWTETPE